MKSTIGVYENQLKAIAAIDELKAGGFPADQISLLGHAAGETEDVEIDSTIVSDGQSQPDIFERPIKIATRGMGIGVVVGPILGALAGVGLLAIPGLGLLVGAGAVAGAVAGFDAGLVGGGLISALAIAVGGKKKEEQYHAQLKEGHYLIIAQGTPEEIQKAHDILDAHAAHVDLDIHHD